jgi:hypothetical protein
MSASESRSDVGDRLAERAGGHLLRLHHRRPCLDGAVVVVTELGRRGVIYRILGVDRARVLVRRFAPRIAAAMVVPLAGFAWVVLVTAGFARLALLSLTTKEFPRA